MTIELHNSDCLDALSFMPDNSVDALITDPPAGISFMGMSWDHDKGGRKQWIAWMTQVMQECFRVMKPGAHGLVWAIPRTSHWTGAALEDAGFEVRDVVTHLFGSGFPKASALSRQNRDAFCQCVSNTHSNEHKTPSPYGADHNGMVHVLGDGAPQPLDAQHLKNKPLDSQDGCHQLYDSCDGLAHALLGAELTSSPQQECALGHSHYDGPSGGKDCESSRTPFLAQCTAPPSSQDSQPLDCAQTSKEICTSLNKKQKQKTHFDNAQLGPYIDHKNELSLASETNKTFPFKCQTCGKPDPNGWYNGGLKPASEHWILVRKPCSEKTVASNVLKWGCGSLNIDGCRIEPSKDCGRSAANSKGTINSHNGFEGKSFKIAERDAEYASTLGRFPANLILSHNPDCEDDQCSLGCAAAMLDAQSGMSRSNDKRKGEITKSKARSWKNTSVDGIAHIGYIDHGGASRFFYCAKVSSSERNAGCEDIGEKRRSDARPNSGDLSGKFPDHDIGVPNIINTQGRFPANLIISHNPECEDDQCSLGCAAAMLDEQSLAGGMHSAGKARPKQIHKGDFGVIKHGDRERLADNRFGDVGGASRFFYCAKTSTGERNAGLEGMPKVLAGDSSGKETRSDRPPNHTLRENHHPTVKPQKLMRYLCRLITPPSGVVLDPFMGSGSTGLAALSEGFRFIGIEKEQEYFEIAKGRIDNR